MEPAKLAIYTAVTVDLPVGQQRVYGREHTNKALQNVSRWVAMPAGWRERGVRRHRCRRCRRLHQRPPTTHLRTRRCAGGSSGWSARPAGCG